MPGSKNPGPSVKDDKTYEALRNEGASKEKAARVANAGRSASKKGGTAGRYEDRTKDDLMREARKVGIAGRSRMSKGELAKALRNH